MGEFDEYYIAKVFSFKDKYDYYNKCSCKQYLSSIVIPTIVIHAKDDPFIDENTLATSIDIQSAPIRLLYFDHGGHCGFVADESSYEGMGIPQYGWLADELGRGLSHIHEKTHENKTINEIY